MNNKHNKKSNLKITAFLIIVMVGLGVAYYTNKNIQGGCFQDKQDIFSTLTKNNTVFNNFYENISKTVWIDSKAEIIDATSPFTDSFVKDTENYQSMNESNFKENCQNIQNTVKEGSRLAVYMQTIMDKIAETEKNSANIKKDSKCYNDKTCYQSLDDQLNESVSNLHSYLKKEKRIAKEECSYSLNAAKTIYTDGISITNKIIQLVTNSTWIINKTQYLDPITQIRQQVQFDHQRIKSMKEEQFNNQCSIFSDDISKVARFTKDIDSQITLIETIKTNQSRINKESNCSTENECNLAMQNRLDNSLKNIVKAWEKEFDIGQTIDNELNCYAKREELQSKINGYISSHEAYIKATNEATWFSSDYRGKTEGIEMLIEAIKDDKKEMVSLDKNEYNKNCTKYAEMVKVGDDFEKYLKTSTIIIDSINKDKEGILKNSACKSPETCNKVLMDKFKSTIKPKEVELDIKYLNPNENLLAIYPNCYKQKDKMIDYVEGINKAQVKFVNKLQNTPWIGPTFDIEKSISSNETKNKEFLNFLEVANADEINQNCGSWPNIYEKYKTDLKLYEVTISGIDYVNQNKSDILRNSSCTHEEVCNAVLRRKLGLIILPVVLESKNDILKNKFK